jgi:hypothetical protein
LHPLLNESDQISTKVLDILFTRIIEPQKSNNKEAYSLACSLLKKGNQHFEYLVQNHLNNVLLTSRNSISNNLTLSAISAAGSGHYSGSGNLNTSGSSGSGNDDSFLLNSSMNNLVGQSNEMALAAGVHGSGATNQFISDKLCLIIYELYAIRPAFLDLLMPQLEYKLKSSDLKERREYTRLLSKMFSEKDSQLAKKYPQLWEAYLERFADMNEDIRRICVQHICDFLIQQSNSIKSITESAAVATANSATVISDDQISNTNSTGSSQILEQIIEQVKSRSLDSEESIRHDVLQEILKAIKLESNLITIDLLNILKDRTLDVKVN